MARRRAERERIRSLKKGYYHLSTDGWGEGFLFHNQQQYSFGMVVMGLLTLLFDITIYDFSLMPNHVHLLLSGTGASCLAAFDYLRQKISARLRKDGYPPLPEDYWFKLVAVEDPEQMKNNFIYIDRNAYEIQQCIPSGYPWGAGYLHFSLMSDLISGMPASAFSKRKLEEMTGSRISIPAHWQFHPRYGLLPSSFVDNRLFLRLFQGPKDYESRLVKDYEAFVKIGRTLDEVPDFAPNELKDIVELQLQNLFPGRRLRQLSNEEKGRLATILSKEYDLTAEVIASSLGLSGHIVQQLLRAKDFGKRR
ncbi:MAG: hypothetical protein J6P56_10045 [Bacteroidales bacterium]|nr:hypothetical protein [Bacteroidales bacterium]